MPCERTPTDGKRCPPGDDDNSLPNPCPSQRGKSKRSISDGTRGERQFRSPGGAIKRRRVRRFRSFSTSAPTRCRLRPCRSMKVSSSDATERRSFGTFMRPSLATNLAAQREPAIRAHDPIGPGRPRYLPATTPPAGTDSDLGPEQSGGAGTDGGQEAVVPPPRTPTTPAPR